MHFRSLRNVVNTIGLVVAITTAVALPSGYLAITYGNATEELAFKARLNASRIAQYVYSHDVMWQYQQLRISELLRLPHDAEQPIRQSVYDNTQELVLEEGDSLAAPTVARVAPITVRGAAVGRVEIATSLQPILFSTALVALLSALLGFAIYYAIRSLPLRVLDRTLGALHDAERSLATQNGRLDTALTNMAQGLCMFNSEQRLLIANRRFAQMFKIPCDDLVPGMPLRDVLALVARAFPDPQSLEIERLTSIAQSLSDSAVMTLTDGRIIAISRRPTGDGGFVATFDDITEQRRAEERIRHLAHFDALTDLPNRVTFYERATAILGHRRRAEKITVLSIDLDRFKSVNDMLGHPIGDRLLQVVADRLRSCVRADDVVARLGGDEFAVVVVPNEDSPNPRLLATRLIDVISAPYDLDGHQVVVGASIGIAIAPADGEQPDVIMRNADLALYRAKADGGGLYRFFEAEMDARMQARRLLELDLRKAIVNGEFELYYQPIINLKTGRITSCEALIRWHHPARGMVSPGEFIPLAEETGLIIPLGEWVLRRACAEAMRWPSNVMVAVNLSPAQFKSRNLVEVVTGALADSGLPADRLELEITELVLLQESDGAFTVLHQLRKLGIKFAMDDFGTGYSSLGYLRSFPFDKIKIDQSFIRDLHTKEDSVAIVRAVVGLSSSLGITTIAEGVETKEQLARLTTEGCHEAQGFLFSRPRPAAEIEHLLAEVGPAAAVA